MKANCPICNKPFNLFPRTVKRKKEKVFLCSQKCRKIHTKNKLKAICLICNKSFQAFGGSVKKYCSIKCAGIGNRSENNYLWKGNKASYRTKHHWIVVRMGKADHCEHCGLNKIPKGMKRYFQWANISGLYLRDISDFISLCVKCHRKFDGYGS